MDKVNAGVRRGAGDIRTDLKILSLKNIDFGTWAYTTGQVPGDFECSAGAVLVRSWCGPGPVPVRSWSGAGAPPVPGRSGPGAVRSQCGPEPSICICKAGQVPEPVPAELRISRPGKQSGASQAPGVDGVTLCRCRTWCRTWCRLK